MMKFTNSYKPASFALRSVASATALVVALSLPVAPAAAQATDGPASLLITDEPLPRDLKENVYSKPMAVQSIRPEEIRGPNYFAPEDTLVTHKVDQLRNELADLQTRVAALTAELTSLQKEGQERATEYYAAVATVNTQLQTGTTPGNPRLLRMIGAAEANLENLSSNISELSALSIDIAQTASVASFLLEGTRATYGLSGAVEEDHVLLAELEDTINNTIVVIERITNNVNDDISRASAYLSSERNNLRTLALAVSNGDLYGKSLSNRPFSSASPFLSNASAGAAARAPAAPAATAGIGAAPVPSVQPASAATALRPLVKIRFDRSDVQYEQPLYVAVNEALERFPEAQFELVAVHPGSGNAAQVAIESTRARRNAEKVLRTLTQMGLPLDRIDLSYSESEEARNNEVHLYIR